MPGLRPMSIQDRPSKRDAFQAFLAEGWVSLHLDARRDGVVVPDSFGREPHLVLQYGRDMPIPITDLDVTDEGVSATLSFARTPHRTHVPWSAVYVVACTDGRGILYHEDVPEEVALVATPPPPGAAQAPGSDRPRTEMHAPAPARRLHSVPADADPAPDDDDDEAPAPTRRRRPTLRLVK